MSRLDYTRLFSAIIEPNNVVCQACGFFDPEPGMGSE